MVNYNTYINEHDYVWYDSSNVLFSECIDTNEETKTLKIVFKNGRKYLYQNVDVHDYIMLKTAESNGSAFNKYIKKYKCVRLPDVDVSEIEELKIKMGGVVEKMENANTTEEYLLEYNRETKDFKLFLGDTVVYEGVDDNVNIIRLFRCMNMCYKFKEIE